MRLEELLRGAEKPTAYGCRMPLLAIETAANAVRELLLVTHEQDDATHNDQHGASARCGHFRGRQGSPGSLSNRSTTVRIHVDDGVATLTGSVPVPSERADAEDAVRYVAGVRRLVNEVAVAQTISPQGFEPPEERS